MDVSGANFKKGRRANPGALGKRESLACQIGPKFKLCTRTHGEMSYASISRELGLPLRFPGTPTHTPHSIKSLPRTFSHGRLSGRQQAHPLPTRSSMSLTEITSGGSISGPP